MNDTSMYKYTGVSATEDEEKSIRCAAISVSGHLKPNTNLNETIHGFALSHGLPEIQGYYGYDFKRHEFITLRWPS